MTLSEDKALGMPLVSKEEPVTVSHIYKLTYTQLKQMFSHSTNIDHQQKLLKEQGMAEGILKKLASDKDTGIIGDERDINRRKAVFGYNSKPLAHSPAFIDSFLQVLQDKTWWAVGITAILSGICGAAAHGWKGLVEGISIIIAGLIMMMILTYSDLVKDRRFVSLQSLIKEENIPVIRGKFGATHSRSVWELVVGDIILLSAGDRIPADCLLLESSDLQVEEKIQNEEDQDRRKTNKNQSDPFLYADSLVLKGTCKALVCCVGPVSTRGPREEKINTDIDTKLQVKLKNLEGHFTVYAAISSAVIFILMLILLIITLSTFDESTAPANQPGIAGQLFSKLTSQFNFAVVLWMVSVPEGLSLAIGISLAFSVMKMYNDKLLVRNLDAPEKMGSIEEICCGKTGTITTGNMKVAQFHCEKAEVIKNTRKNTLLNCELSDMALALIQESILYNCEARIEMDQTIYTPVGNPTEIAFLRFLQDAEIPVHLLIQKKLGNIRAVCPFSSINKRSITVVRSPDNQNVVTVFMKGAPEEIIKHCQIRLIDGQETPIDQNDCTNQVNAMAAQPLRVITFAYVQMSFSEWERYEHTDRTPEQNIEDMVNSQQLPFCYIGSFGLRDTLRPRVQSCVQYARDHARLGVRLVSGDHIETAKMVAIKAGILKPEESGKPYAVMDASQFRDLVEGVEQFYDQNEKLVQRVKNEDNFREIAHDLRVLARANARDKHMLIVGLQGLNRKVAATGDGINDLDAISKADVGISMGSGVSAAKECSDLILTGDDFEASLRAVMWGRNIYHNITRFLQFQVTVNISCLVVLFIGIIVFNQQPLTSVQLLWINLIMDIFAALALATEPPLKSVIEGSPYTDNVALLSPTVWRQILGVSLYNIFILILVISFGAMAAGLDDYTRETSTLVAMPSGYEERIAKKKPSSEDLLYIASQAKAKHFTYIFNIFVFLQLFNMINCRKIGKRDFNVFESFFHNWYFIILFCLIGGVQFVGTQYFSFIFRTIPMNRTEWGSCIAVGSTVLIWGAILKLLPERWFSKLNTSKLINEDKETDNMLLKKINEQKQSAPNAQVEGNDEEDVGDDDDHFDRA